MAEAVSIARDAMRGPPWDPELIARVQENLFEDEEISLFASATRDRFDHGHAIGMLAATIGTDDFSQNTRDKYEASLPKQKKEAIPIPGGRKLASFILPATVLRGAAIVHSPENNLDFTPADLLHFDLRASAKVELATRFLDALHAGEITYTFVARSDYRAYAAIALATCIGQFGDLTGPVPQNWSRSKRFSAEEQLARLRWLADDRGRQGNVRYHLN